MVKQINLFLEVESTLGKDAMKIVEMTTKTFKYYINLVDKTTAQLEQIDYNFKKPTVDKCYQTALPATEKSFVKEASCHLI